MSSLNLPYIESDYPAERVDVLKSLLGLREEDIHGFLNLFRNYHVRATNIRRLKILAERVDVLKSWGLREEDIHGFLNLFKDYRLMATKIRRLKILGIVYERDVPQEHIPPVLEGILVHVYIRGRRYVLRIEQRMGTQLLNTYFLEVGDADITLTEP
ncbi:hypothetical protein HRbin04_00877 [archaeon HR04]|nr:hypothetical protein HRbin04_00877 [archaeon HR04]